MFVAEVRMNVKIKGIYMRECLFYVMQKKSDRDDATCDFVNKNNLVIHLLMVDR